MVNGAFSAVRDNKVGSGMLTPLIEADCVAVLGEGFAAPQAGDRLKVIRFDAPLSEIVNDAYNR
jgi:molybdopterin biosynthesis enzyme